MAAEFASYSVPPVLTACADSALYAFGGVQNGSVVHGKRFSGRCKAISAYHANVEKTCGDLNQPKTRHGAYLPLQRHSCKLAICAPSNTEQRTVLEPSLQYGVTKQASTSTDSTTDFGRTILRDMSGRT